MLTCTTLYSFELLQSRSLHWINVGKIYGIVGCQYGCPKVQCVHAHYWTDSKFCWSSFGRRSQCCVLPVVNCASHVLVHHMYLCTTCTCAPHVLVHHVYLCTTCTCAPHVLVHHMYLCITCTCAPHVLVYHMTRNARSRLHRSRCRV
jgi:hypothetical protein